MKKFSFLFYAISIFWNEKSSEKATFLFIMKEYIQFADNTHSPGYLVSGSPRRRSNRERIFFIEASEWYPIVPCGLARQRSEGCEGSYRFLAIPVNLVYPTFSFSFWPANIIPRRYTFFSL